MPSTPPAAVTQATAPPPTEAPPATPTAGASDAHARMQAYLAEGKVTIKHFLSWLANAGHYPKAVAEGFDKVPAELLNTLLSEGKRLAKCVQLYANEPDDQ